MSRSTIYRKVDEGVLSTTNLSDGSKGVDTAKPIRVFGGLKPRHEETTLDSPEVVARQTHATGSDTTRSDNHETVILKTKIELLENQLRQAEVWETDSLDISISRARKSGVVINYVMLLGF